MNLWMLMMLLALPMQGEPAGLNSSVLVAQADAKPADAKPADAKPADTKPADAKPADTKPADTKPADTKPADTKPADTKPADTKPADTKPAEAKPADTKPADAKPADAKPADAKPADTKPADTKPADTKPAEAKPADTKPADTKPAEKSDEKKALESLLSKEGIPPSPTGGAEVSGDSSADQGLTGKDATNAALLMGLMLAVFVLPLVVGPLVASSLRVPELGGRIGLCVFAILFSIAPFIYRGQSAIHLGIDLAGGTNLVYAVDRQAVKQSGKKIDSEVMDRMRTAISKRIDPSGAEEVTVRKVGQDRLEIIIPGADADIVASKKRAIVELGSLEFAILANRRDHASQIAAAGTLAPAQDEVREKGVVVAAWKELSAGEEFNTGDRGTMRQVPRRDPITGQPYDAFQLLVVLDPPRQRVTGEHLLRARPDMDGRTGAPCVSFQFNTTGSNLFYRLTSRYQPDPTDKFTRHLAILLNDKIHSAPRLNEPISGSGQITGGFDSKEVNRLVDVLNAGALEVPLIREPISEFSISPLLGADVQRKGVTAVTVSLASVFVFALFYYRVAGLIACMSLALNLLLIVGAMSFIDASFTLPGIAGIVLTIGMAVDSNVLIYERMREEVARGASLRMAIENGFEKAFSAIIDSNVTTLFTAVILYMIGSEQIRGFAISLFIGLTMSLFTVLIFGHVLFQIAERNRWIKELKFMQFVGQTNIDFLKYGPIAALGSLVVIAVGFACLYGRGQSNMDIDFTGGTMVTFEFVSPQKTDEVKQHLKDALKAEISIERLTLQGEQPDGDGGKRFRMRTTSPDTQQVSRDISKAFEGGTMDLVRVTVESVSEPKLLEDAKTLTFETERFIGGHEVAVQLKGGIAAGTLADYVTEELRRINPETYKTSVAGSEGVEKLSGEQGKTAKTKYSGLKVYGASEVTAADLKAAVAAVQTRLAASPVFDEVNAFDTSVAFDTQKDAAIAVVLSIIVIVIYIWFRFERMFYGIAAVVALVHDVLVTLGSIAIAAYLADTPIGKILLLEDFKINMGLIASLLTIVGYSLNDTIVIFDRIREIRGKSPNVTYDMVNLSVNQTMSRTILTALMTLIVVVVMYIFGGEGIHAFAYSFVIGVLAGTYSTVYIANPVLLWAQNRELDAIKRAAATSTGAKAPA